jgi:cell wall-associated NlpC family hydrolase
MLPSAAARRVAALRARRRVLDQEAWMVGRSPSVAPLLLVLAAFAIASPATADPGPLLPFDPPAQPASLVSAAVATDSVPPAATSSDSDAVADDSETVDPTEAIGVPAVAAAPAQHTAPRAATAADLRDQPTDSGELGVEYQLSVRDAASFLDRLSARFKRLVEQAMTYLGTPYRRGGTTRSGVDCSGLVGAVYGEQGLDLPRTAAQQFAEGVAVAASDLRPGDLVFFRNTYKRGISHVGIYIGDGRFLHAAGRRHGVIVSELSRPYYRLRYAGARRPAAAPEAATADRQASQGSQGTPDLAGDAQAASTLASAPRR